jgi:hypothetical protein
VTSFVVGPNGTCYALDSGQDLWVNGKLGWVDTVNFAIGPDGTLYKLDTGGNLSHLPWAGPWQNEAGKTPVTSFAVSPLGTCYALDSGQDLYVNGKLGWVDTVSFAVGQDGTLYKLDTGGNLSHLTTAGSWQMVDTGVLNLVRGQFNGAPAFFDLDKGGNLYVNGKLGWVDTVNFAIGSDGNLNKLDTAGNLSHLTSAGSWQPPMTMVTKLASNPDGSMFALKSNGTLWYSTTGTSGSFRQCSLGGLSVTSWPVTAPNYSGVLGLNGAPGADATLSTSGLPAGLGVSVSGNTITISGTPSTHVSGNYSFTLSVYYPVVNFRLVSAYSLTLNPGPVASLIVKASGTATVGSTMTVTITAEDAYGNVATGDNGVVTLTSSNANSLPSVSLGLQNGVCSVSLRPAHSGPVTLTPSQGSVRGSGLGLSISPSLYLYTYDLFAYNSDDEVVDEVINLTCDEPNDSQANAYISNEANGWGLALDNEGIAWDSIYHVIIGKVAGN